MLILNKFLLGPIQLDVWHDKQTIHRCRVLQASEQALDPGPKNDFADSIQVQLEEYANHHRSQFDLPLNMQGTPFRVKVWQQMLAIPAGSPKTYGQISTLLQSAAQPVGGACKANQIPFFIPCHRIVGARSIGGYDGEWEAGKRVDIKTWLLDHEAGFRAN